MKKKYIKRILSIMIIMILIVNNIGYAVSFTQEEFKDSLTRMFKSNVVIELEVKSKIQPGEGVTIEGDQYVTSTSKTTYTPEENIEVTDSQIICKDSKNEDDRVLKIDYELKDNKLTFNMNTSLEEMGINPEEDPMSLIAVVFFYNQITSIGYLSAAEVVGVDLNIAQAYLTQLSNTNLGEDNQKIDTEIYKFDFNTDDSFNIDGFCEIDLDKLSKIDESYLDGTVTAKVTITYSPIEDDKNDEINNEMNNITNVENNIDNEMNDTNTINNTNTENTIIKDDTISNNKIPDAGANIIEYALILLVVITLVAYFKSKQFDDIK